MTLTKTKLFACLSILILVLIVVPPITRGVIIAFLLTVGIYVLSTIRCQTIGGVDGCRASSINKDDFDPKTWCSGTNISKHMQLDIHPDKNINCLPLSKEITDFARQECQKQSNPVSRFVSKVLHIGEDPNSTHAFNTRKDALNETLYQTKQIGDMVFIPAISMSVHRGDEGEIYRILDIPDRKSSDYIDRTDSDVVQSMVEEAQRTADRLNESWADRKEYEHTERQRKTDLEEARLKSIKDKEDAPIREYYRQINETMPADLSAAEREDILHHMNKYWKWQRDMFEVLNHILKTSRIVNYKSLKAFDSWVRYRRSLNKYVDDQHWKMMNWDDKKLLATGEWFDIWDKQQGLNGPTYNNIIEGIGHSVYSSLFGN